MRDRSHREPGWRAAALAVALFAITLNFLQPLVHAAAMRDGAPSTLWSVFCNASADSHEKSPLPAAKHECCLGLAHEASVTAPASAFTTVERTAPAIGLLPPTDRPTPAGIRDGPHRPRGPPSFV